MQRLRRELHIVTHSKIKRKVVRNLPGVFDKAVNHLHPEIVLACVRNRINHLNKGVIMRPGKRVGRSCREEVLHPGSKVVGWTNAFGVAIQTASLKEIDHDFMNKIQIASGFKSVSAMCSREHIGDLITVLV